MDVRVGASFALSVAIVGIAAVALYEPDPPPQGAARPPASESGTVVDAVDVPVTEAVEPPKVSERRPIPPEPRAELATIPPAPAAHPKVVADVAKPSKPAMAPKPRPVKVPQPRSAFTSAEEGETLADLARRVYGTDDDLRHLWLANRDQLETPESPLKVGMLLRTP